MTREESIDRLRKISEKTPIRTNGDDLVAITMAIQALSQEPCDDTISRQAVLEMAYDMSEIDGEHFTDPHMVVDVEYIQKLPSVNPQPCDDAISRQAVLDLINTDWKYEGLEEPVSSLPPVTQKSGKCKDCKWWRDSDGVYRRGVKAESKCPINTVSVANGWGYCYMFESQESEDKECTKKI